MYVTEFRVKGKGFFPFDMLRRDACYPASDLAVMNLATDDMEERVVCLRTLHAHKYQTVNFDRWASFGWTVISHTTRKV